MYIISEESRAASTKINPSSFYQILALYLNEQMNITVLCNIFRIVR